MVNWSDPKEMAREGEAYLKLVHVFCGVYIWDLLMTSGFEYSLIIGRRKPTWSLVFFFMARYCMLFCSIGLLISFSLTSPINCQALYTFNGWSANTAVACASASLMLRAIALWERKLIVAIPLVIISIGHWVELYRSFLTFRAGWDPTTGTCVVTFANATFFRIIFFYTMSFDFIVSVCAAVALLRKYSLRTGLWRLLFQDGLIYFLVSLTTNSVTAIMNVLDLNPVMNTITAIPTVYISVIAACRAVIRLQEYYDCENMAPTSSSSNPYPRVPIARPEVHITKEHITMAELYPHDAKGKETRTSIDLKFATPTAV